MAKRQVETGPCLDFPNMDYILKTVHFTPLERKQTGEMLLVKKRHKVIISMFPELDGRPVVVCGERQQNKSIWPAPRTQARGPVERRESVLCVSSRPLPQTQP